MPHPHLAPSDRRGITVLMLAIVIIAVIVIAVLAVRYLRTGAAV